MLKPVSTKPVASNNTAPVFDPNQPYEPVAQASTSTPQFDPSKPYEPVDPNKSQTFPDVTKNGQKISTTLSGTNRFNNNSNPTGKEEADNLTNSLPGVGAAVGGYMGGFPGAAAGGAVGTAAKKTVQGFRDYGTGFLSHSPSVEDVSDVVKGSGEGIAQELVGRGIGKAAEALKTSPKVDADAIQAASDRLGIKPTPGMTNSSVAAQKLESSLNQSPSLAGTVVRSEVNPVKAGLQSAAEDVVSGSSGQSAHQAGGEAQGGILSDLGEQYQNVQDAYEPFNNEMKKMKPSFDDKAELADNVANAGKGNLSLKRNIKGLADNVNAKLADSTSLEDVENIRKQVSKELTSAYNDRDFNAVDGISKIEDHLNNFRDDQFEKLAKGGVDSSEENFFSEPGKAGENTGSDMVEQYKAAQKQYSEFANKVEPLKQALKLKTTNPKGVVDAIADMPEEKLADILSQTKYVKSAQAIQDSFPETFNKIKQYQLEKIKADATVGGKLDPVRLVKASNNLSPEFKQMIFGDKTAKLSDIETIVNSLPAKIGQSGTPEGEMYNQSWNPAQQGAEAIRYGQRAALTSPKVQGLLTPQNIKNASTVGGFLATKAYDKEKGLMSR